jgi:hypothetical protein
LLETSSFLSVAENSDRPAQYAIIFLEETVCHREALFADAIFYAGKRLLR